MEGLRKPHMKRITGVRGKIKNKLADEKEGKA